MPLYKIWLADEGETRRPLVSAADRVGALAAFFAETGIQLRLGDPGEGPGDGLIGEVPDGVLQNSDYLDTPVWRVATDS